MTHKPNLTIDDIARELGVSKTTVSRAISGKGRISAATRTRVQEYITEHNYRPSAAAKGLAESKTYNLALVLPRDFVRLDIPFVRKSMSAICDEAFCNDYNIMVCLTTNDASHLIRTLDYRKVDGVILARTVENDQMLTILTERGIPFATLGSLPAGFRGTATVEADHDQTGGCRAFSLEILSGKAGKTALLGNDLNYIVNQSRLSGFTAACQELGLPLEQTPIRMGINDLPGCRKAVEELLETGVRRFLCMDDETCTRTLTALTEKGLNVPGDAEVSSLSDSEALESHTPPISALSFDAAELGRAACRELLRALHDEAFDPAPRLGYEIRLRQSTK